MCWFPKTLLEVPGVRTSGGPRREDLFGKSVSFISDQQWASAAWKVFRSFEVEYNIGYLFMDLGQQIPHNNKLGTVKKVRNISKIQNIFTYLKNHLISAAITILSPKIINFCCIRKYRQKGILIHFFYFFYFYWDFTGCFNQHDWLLQVCLK